MFGICQCTKNIHYTVFAGVYVQLLSNIFIVAAQPDIAVGYIVYIMNKKTYDEQLMTTVLLN